MRLSPFVLACSLLGPVAGCSSHSSDERVEGAGNAITGDAAPARATATLKFTPQLVLEKVLERKNRPFDAQKPMPEIRYESRVTLAEFQDALESQWGMRPSVFTNAYSVTQNVIYLIDDASYYERLGRFIDDSLAHELTHYVQVVYQGWQLDPHDDSIEMDAIDVQTWFRETFCRTP